MKDRVIGTVLKLFLGVPIVYGLIVILDLSLAPSWLLVCFMLRV